MLRMLGLTKLWGQKPGTSAPNPLTSNASFRFESIDDLAPLLTPGIEKLTARLTHILKHQNRQTDHHISFKGGFTQSGYVLTVRRKEADGQQIILKNVIIAPFTINPNDASLLFSPKIMAEQIRKLPTDLKDFFEKTPEIAAAADMCLLRLRKTLSRQNLEAIPFAAPDIRQGSHLRLVASR